VRCPGGAGRRARRGVKRSAHGIGRSLELNGEKALGSPAFQQLRALAERHRRGHAQRLLIQQGSLAMSAHLRRLGSRCRREAQHRFVIAGRVRVVGEAGKIRCANDGRRQRREDGAMQAALAILADGGLEDLAGQPASGARLRASTAAYSARVPSRCQSVIPKTRCPSESPVVP
jgi:hypothetical protein